MKKILILMLSAIIFYSMSFAQTNKELFESGVQLFKNRQYQQAIDQFSKLIELSPDNADAYKNRGVSYVGLEKFDLAIQDFETAKSIFPELPGLFSNLGVAWYYKKDYQKAIENYNTEIRISPDNAQAYFNRALSLSKLNQNQQALADLSRALELEPDFYWATCYTGDLLALEGKREEAIKYYEKTIEQDPGNTYAADKLARIRKERKEGSPATRQTQSSELESKKEKIYTLQIGAFQNEANARRLEQKMLENEFDVTVTVLVDKKNRTWYLVRSGNFSTSTDARSAIPSLEEKMNLKPVVRPRGDW